MVAGDGTYIASLDVGTTTVRCLVLDSETNIKGSAYSNIKLLYPKDGYVEIDPEELWETILKLIKESIANSGLNPRDITCLGITTQRATFITWNKSTSKPYHNFITWKDIRARELVKKINRSFALRVIRWAAYAVYLLSASTRFLMGSKLQLSSNHVTSRLLWVIENVPNLREEIAKNNVMFGTLETWLVYRLTKQATYVTDITNASATGFFDPFTLSWGSWAINILGIPLKILPSVVSNDYNFGNVDADLLGANIPIKAVMADQSAGMFGTTCFAENDLKVTLGTGAFLDINTSDKIHHSLSGLYPLVGWQIGEEMVFFSEAPCNDAGTLIQWIINAGYVEDLTELDRLSKKGTDTNGLYFIPAFSGLGPPINDEKAGSGFIGVTPTTKKEHLVLAILEGICFRVGLAYFALIKERQIRTKKIRIDGGMANNDFVCQLIANLTGLDVVRYAFKEAGALGITFVAGLTIGIWKDRKDLESLKKIEKTFVCETHNRSRYLEKMKRWEKAAKRFSSWYEG